MKNKYIGISIWVLLILFGVEKNFAQSSNSSTWAETLSKKTASIDAIYLPGKPYAYKDKDGNLTGVEIDIFKEFIRHVQNANGVILAVNWIEATSFKDLYTQVKNAKGGVFGIGSVTITDERQSEIGFSAPYLINKVFLVTNSSIPELSSDEDLASQLKGKTAIVVKGTTHAQYMLLLKEKLLPNLTIKEVGGSKEVIETISKDSNYFSYLDITTIWPEVEKKTPIKAHGFKDISAEKYGFIFPKSSDWATPMNAFMTVGSGFRSTAQYKTILMKHYGKEVTNMLYQAH